MMKRVILLLMFSTWLFAPNQVFAQETSDSTVSDSAGEWEIVMVSGSQFIGRIISEDEKSIRIITNDLGEIELLKASIKSREKLSINSSGVYWPKNHQAYRHFLTPTAIPIDKGDINYQNTWIFFNSITAGITKNISVDVGIIPFFLFGDEVPSPIWITPKVNFEVVKDGLYLGGGALIGTVSENSQSYGFGYFYGTSTFGDRDRNISIGIAYGMADGEVSEYPLMNISAMYRVGKKGYLLGETFFVPGQGGGGILFLGGRTDMGFISVDYGGIIPIFDGAGIVIPWLSVNVPLSRK